MSRFFKRLWKEQKSTCSTLSESDVCDKIQHFDGIDNSVDHQVDLKTDFKSYLSSRNFNLEGKNTLLHFYQGGGKIFDYDLDYVNDNKLYSVNIINFLLKKIHTNHNSSQVHIFDSWFAAELLLRERREENYIKYKKDFPKNFKVSKRNLFIFPIISWQHCSLAMFNREKQEIIVIDTNTEYHDSRKIAELIIE